MTHRPARQYRPWSLELEARRLLATGHAIRQPIIGDVGFVGGMIPQVFMQEDGPETLQIYRTSGKEPFQVRVTAVSSVSGVIGPLDQTITLDDNLGYVDVTVPIIPGAYNPGEADVTLTITPIDPPPHLTISDPIVLRIFSSKDALPPTIVSAQGTPQGIVVNFSKPMDPAGASNVGNYTLKSSSTKFHETNGLLANAAFYASLGTIWMTPTASTTVKTIQIKSAEYDPATNSVTLVPKQKLHYHGQFTVTQGASGGHQKARLTDLEGKPINDFQRPAGTFSVYVAG